MANFKVNVPEIRLIQRSSTTIEVAPSQANGFAD